jgi:hypothetical protein
MRNSNIIKIIGKLILFIIFFIFHFGFIGIDNSFLIDIAIVILLFVLYFGDVIKLQFLTPVYSPKRKKGVFVLFAFFIISTVIYNEISNSYIKDWYNLIFIVVGILISIIGYVGLQLAYYILFPAYILYVFFILPLPSEDIGGVYFLMFMVFTPVYFLIVTAVGFVLEAIAQANKFYK